MLDGQFDQFTEKYTFEHIKTYHLQPEEDLYAALNMHVKVSLDPHKEYVIRAPGEVHTSFYLLGNGAKVRIECADARVFIVRNSLAGPAIGGMHIPTLENVVFVSREEQTGSVVYSLSSLLVHGCTFVDVGGTCIRSCSGLSLKGCIFVACSRGIRSDGDFPVSIRQCTFKCTVVCIATKCDFTVLNCLSDECYSFLLTCGTGVMRGNSITGSVVESVSRYKDLEMVTCFGGKTHLLCTVHIVENTRAMQPTIENNNFYRAKLFFGYRRGIYSLRHCSLHYCHICLDENSGAKLSLTGTYGPTVRVSQVASLDFTKRFLLKCECGTNHAAVIPQFADVTSEHLRGPNSRTCQCLEFSSDEE